MTGPYDASARGGSVVSARRAYWNGRPATGVVRDFDTSSTVDVSSAATTLSTPDLTCVVIYEGRGTLAAGDVALTDETLAARGSASPEVVALAAKSREATWRGDTDEAFATLGAAGDVAATAEVMVSEPAAAVVTVVDGLGREVARLHDGLLAPGPRAFTLDTSGWAAGVYAVRVAVGSQSTTTRLIVVR